MGLTKRTLIENDVLFFKQLLYPMCDPARSRIKNCPRKAYYTKIQLWTTKYAVMIVMTWLCSHEYVNATAEDLVRWNNVVTKVG